MADVGIAVVGCGRAAANRVAPAIRRSRGALLVGFCSRDRERARQYAEQFCAPEAYDRLDALLVDDRVEAVYIGTPNALHAEQALACLRAGRHVLVDKPMALTTNDARRMQDAAKAAGRTLTVLHQQRFHPAHGALRERVHSGALGRLTWIRAEMGYLSPPDLQNWRQDPALAGGGPGWDLGPHAIDMLLAVGGQVRSAAGRTANVRFRYPVEDFFHGQIVFASGAIGLVDLSFCGYSQGGRLEVRGDESTFVSEGSLMAAHDYRWALYRGPGRMAVETQEGAFTEQFVRAVEDFADAVRGNRPPAVTAEDGVAVCRVLEDLYVSARNRDERPAPGV